jgi:hypothetical protein
MRARRPELFSDSKTDEAVHIGRTEFEYHLDTLTSRKQETEFEYFCRRLLQKEVCPNLIPQTGPTGGGDSKVDTETYPVSEMVSDRWYEGVANAAGNERWAFAFSAKRDWKPKLKSDVHKIFETGRNYKLVYFVTNQFVRDKDRAQIEDDLSTEHGVPIRILDRSWIVERVFEGRHIQLAIDTLGLSGAERQSRIIGPRDLEREAELTELDREISDPERYEGVQYQLAEDCLRSALLARSLERPRSEVEGRFVRAERIASKLGHQQQLLRIAYAQAWTANFWYDDFHELSRLYESAEKFAIETDRATDVELIVNLWQLLISALRRGQLEEKEAKLTERTKTLKTTLERLAKDHQRPNNALLAKAYRYLMELVEAVQESNSARTNSSLEMFKSILAEAGTLGSFPVTHFSQLIRELGNAFTDNSTYDELFESTLAILEVRKSEGESGLVLLERGTQKLRGGKRYDAIKLFGRAQEKLIKREYRDKLGRRADGLHFGV